MTTSSLENRKQRHLAFWNNEPCDRPLLYIMTPNKDTSEAGEYLRGIQNADLSRYWTDPEVLVKRALHGATHPRVDDFIPAFRMPIGPTMLSSFLGAKVEFGKDTVWLHPCTDDLASLEDIAFDPDNSWWKIIEEFCHISAREAKAGGFAPVVPDLGGVGDSLAALVGSDRLLEDMMDRPDLVKKVLRKMIDILVTCNKRIYEILASAETGTSCWLQLWSPGKLGILQNDLSIMLSTDMYQEFFAEEFAALSPLYDHRIFHLDGTACQRHLPEFLLNIPGLNAVQLGSNPGTRAMEILPAIKMLQEAGKGILSYVFTDEIEEFFSQVSPRGFAMVTSASSSEEAEDIVRRTTLACKR